ncbi:unnamed protein product [Sphenostylis stenocarpa]|uniref:Uncharacterized protein n=1 Tax=Sphenostylis stenocarpa TaxID=92480 RepID=A0AA86S6W8_9FABA|nr:unnamed protein product [Sphenostylis stenocarpa]
MGSGLQGVGAWGFNPDHLTPASLPCTEAPDTSPPATSSSEANLLTLGDDGSGINSRGEERRSRTGLSYGSINIALTLV